MYEPAALDDLIPSTFDGALQRLPCRKWRARLAWQLLASGRCSFKGVTQADASVSYLTRYRSFADLASKSILIWDGRVSAKACAIANTPPDSPVNPRAGRLLALGDELE
jgi:hypothetical protein